MNFRNSRRPLAVVIAVLLLGVGVLLSVRSQGPSPVVTASSTPTYTVATSPTAPTAATSTPLATAVQTSGPNQSALATFPLGPLHGQVAWVVRTPSPAAPSRPTGGTRVLLSYELWAMPLDGSTPRLAVRYRSAFTNGSTIDPRDTNVLRRQFSPDGRRLVLSVATTDDGCSQELRVIDLETGAVTIPFHNAFPTATNLDVNPAWSPDGALIAFVRLASTGASGELWVRNPDGSAAQLLWTGCNACQPSSPLIHRASGPPRIYGWLPDSQHIGFDPANFAQNAYGVMDLHGLPSDPAIYAVNTSDPASWRNQSPMFAASTAGGTPPVHTQIVVSDGPDQRSPQIVADVTVNPNDNNVTGVHDPRWDPKGNPLLVYTEYGIEASFVIVDLGARTTKKVSGRVAYADWMPNGDGIVTLEEHPSTAPKSVNVYERDGRIRTSGLFLDSTNTSYTLTDLTARSY